MLRRAPGALGGVGVAGADVDARAAALAAEGVGAYTDGKALKKFIYVPGKIINLVVA